MQIGFNAPTSGPLIDPDSLTRIIIEGEALGFDYVTISDHIMVPRNLESKYPYTDTGEFPAGTQAAWLEQLATTAYIAALTKKLRFVLSVMVVPHRPAVQPPNSCPRSTSCPRDVLRWVSASAGAERNLRR
jgi:alkanesulfonate monooxygenase SsuD/methylene tetrahydromethanopterin reductase-like flavin-dependent oxidoreductase (luciferase family)